MKSIKGIAVVAFALALVFTLTACGGSADSPASSSAGNEGVSAASSESADSEDDGAASSEGESDNANTASSEDESDNAPNSEDSQASESTADAMQEVISGGWLVSTFVGEDVTDATVTSQEEAQEVIDSLVERMGGDDTTDFALAQVIPTETGTTYYIFQQEAGSVMVYGASAKLVADKNGKITGLVSAIMPNVKVPPLDEVAVTKEQAEAKTLETLANLGLADAKAESNYTSLTIIPLPNVAQRYCLAWVVYVASPYGDGDDQGWLANYVSADGEYLYNIPVSEPNGADALKGESIGFDFSAYDQQEQTFDIVKGDETVQVTVPVLVDKESGEVAWLGDAKRKILCVDHTEATQNDQLVSPFEEDGESFNGKDIAVYENFIRIYDYYESMGWQGPDGDRTPSLLLMNYMENGEPGENCLYSGFDGGWQTFAFGRVKDYGLATDVIAHEYTHCVTSTTMTTNLYMNEPGAINEGMSDIMGNLVEMALDGDEGAWILGENAQKGGMRSMSDPPTHYQPGRRWDVYYTLDAPQPTNLNDRGGVHGNSSLLNIISYKLDKAGMPLEDHLYFWMNVALALVPTSDFAQMAELLPWVLEQSGYGQYADALKEAIDEAGYTKLEQPDELPAGAGAIKFTYPDEETAMQGQVRVMFFNEADVEKGITDVWAWPIAQGNIVWATLPADDYYVVMIIGEDPSTAERGVYTGERWVEFNPPNDVLVEMSTPVHVNEGEVIELSTDGLS